MDEQQNLAELVRLHSEQLTALQKEVKRSKAVAIASYHLINDMQPRVRMLNEWHLEVNSKLKLLTTLGIAGSVIAMSGVLYNIATSLLTHFHLW